MKLEFPDAPEFIDQGINDAGIETFISNKKSSIARETAQNSNDAGIKELRPVQVDFDRITIETSEFPGIEDYRKALDECIADNKLLKRDEAIEALEEAKRKIDSQNLSLLLISDKNTTGVSGPYKRDNPFFTLVHATGVSLKSDKSAGGSVGLGKNSALALSPLRTVLYSTQFENKKGKTEFYSMGKSILTSFKDSEGQNKYATGIFGNDSKPITDVSSVPKWMQRKENGLTLVIPGIEFKEDWAFDYAQTLIRNFFHAVKDNQINFNINDGEIKINSGTIRNLFSNENIIKTAKENNDEKDLNLKGKFFEVLFNSGTDKHEIDIPNFGKFLMQTLLSDDGKVKFLIVRNGMTICNNLGPYLHTITGTRGFHSIISPFNSEASKNIRSLETAQHDAIALDRLKSEKSYDKMNAGLRKLDQEIRKRLREIAGIDERDRVELDELKDFFKGPVLKENKGKAEKTPGSEFSHKRGPKKVNSSKISHGLGGDQGETGIRTGVKKTSKKSVKTGGQGSGPSGEITVPVSRSFIPNQDLRKRKIIITPPENGDLTILPKAIGFDGENVPLNVIGCDHGKVVSGTIKNVPVQKDTKIEIQITLDSDFAGQTHMICHLKPEGNSALKFFKNKLGISS